MVESVRISESEWKVMNQLWSSEALTVAELVEALEEDTSWKPRTVKTLLARLIEKGAVTVRAEGRANHYSATVSQEACVRSENRSLLEKVYSGTWNRMLLSFIEQSELTDDDIDELKKMLDAKKTNTD